MMRPDRVVVINLDRRADRWEAFQRRWAAAAPGVDVQRIAGVNMPARPAAGCWQSHLDALRSGPGPVLVLEDDAVFTGAFGLELPDPPEDWRMLRLGGLVQAGAPVGEHWLAVTRAVHTHAYVARDPHALAGHVASFGQVRDVAVALSAGIAGQYRLRPGTVGQAAGASDVSGRDRPVDEFWG